MTTENNHGVSPLTKEEAQRQRSAAWTELCKVLDEIAPDWHKLAPTGLESARLAVRQWATIAARQPSPNALASKPCAHEFVAVPRVGGQASDYRAECRHCGEAPIMTERPVAQGGHVHPGTELHKAQMIVAMAAPAVPPDDEALMRQALGALDDVVRFRETGLGRPPEQTAMDVRTALRARLESTNG